MTTMRSAKDIQQDFASSSGLRSEIIWDSLSPEQSDILMQKIKTIIPDADKNQNVIEKMRADLFENIWAQRKFTNRTLLSAIIYILVAAEKDTGLALQSTTFSCHPVFRTRKCLNDNQTSSGCCMIFIDENSRVYRNWKHFVQNNALPKGTMIAPCNGVYTFNANDEVELEISVTPSARTKSQILNTSDTVAGVGGLMASVPIAAAIAFPISAPIIAVSSAVGLAAAAYCTIRSAASLNDRRQHGQTVALSNRAARNSWFGVAGGVVGLSGSGATKALSYVSSAGNEINIVTKLAVNGLNVSSILLSGTGLVNGIYDLYLKINNEQQLSGLDVLQLATSLLVFTHSINNFKIASKVAARNHNSSICSVLVKQIRKNYSKIYNGSRNTSTSAAKFDIIRTINDIPFKDVLMNLHKINSYLNSGCNTLTAAYPSYLLPKIIKCFNPRAEDFNIAHLIEEFGQMFVQRINNFGNILDILCAMTNYFGDSVTLFLITLSKSFIEEKLNLIDASLHTYVSTESVLYRILMHCVTNYKNFCYEFLENKTGEIYIGIEKYFDSLNPINSTNKKEKCQNCDGFYYICNL